MRLNNTTIVFLCIIGTLICIFTPSSLSQTQLTPITLQTNPTISTVTYGFPAVLLIFEITPITNDSSSGVVEVFQQTAGGNSSISLSLYPILYPSTLGFLSLNTSIWSPGTYSFFARYTPNNSQNTSVSSIINFDITKQKPSLFFSPSNPISITFYKTLILTPTIAWAYNGYPPQGSLSIYLDKSFYSSFASNTSLNFTGLAVGYHTFILSYLGDSNYLAVNSTFTIQVNDFISVRATNNPSQYGTSLGFVISCSSSYMSPLVLYDGNVALGYNNVLCSPIESAIAIASLNVGTHHITFHYNGGSGHAPLSVVVDQVIFIAQSSISVQVQNYTLFVTIFPNNFMGAVDEASGTLQFFVDGESVHTATFEGGSYVHTIADNLLPDLHDAADSHNLTIIYSGSIDFTPVTTSVPFPNVTQAVNVTATGSATGGAGANTGNSNTGGSDSEWSEDSSWSSESSSEEGNGDSANLQKNPNSGSVNSVGAWLLFAALSGLLLGVWV